MQSAGARSPSPTASVEALPPPVTPRRYHCRCGRPVFFGNTQCVGCGTALGYEPRWQRVLPIEPLAGKAAERWWRPVGRGSGRGLRLRRCSRLETPALCNWLVAPDDAAAGRPALCRCCRLLRAAPDLAPPSHALWFGRIEAARRRLVSSLIGLRVPVASLAEDPARGLAFDVLAAADGEPPVVTGHADGVITLDLHEADDSERERRRHELGEPYRTPLGHLRHESGHYYWRRLLQDDAPRLAAWRELFGDERDDYAAALQRHYAQGAPPDWGTRHVSAYASSHPWEDWAETWAHYLHMIDTQDSARSFGLDGSRLALDYEPFAADTLAGIGGDDGSGDGDAAARAFLAWVQSWMQLTGVLNELSRAMGQADFYPFVLSAPALRKLYFVHRLVRAA